MLIGNALNAQQLQSVIYQNWENAAWQDWYLQEISYDGADIISHLYKVWDEATQSWKWSSRSLITNNDNGQPTLVVNQIWMAATDSWDNGSRSVYTYNASGKVETLQLDYWIGSWSPLSKNTYTYDANSYQAGVFAQTWVPETSSWENSTQTTYTNDANGNVLQWISQQWDGIQWINSQKTIQTFNGSNQLTSVIVQTWEDNMAWNNFSRSSYTYDEDRVVFALFQNWDAPNNIWRDDNHGNYTYNPDGTIAFYISQQWQDGIWVNFQKAIYSYATLGLVSNQADGFAIYPNPTADFIRLEMPDNRSVQNIWIIDAHAKTSAVEINLNQIDVRGLASGIYLLQFEADGKTVSKKFLKN